MSLSFSLAKVDDIIHLRHVVLRPGKPIETCNFDGDNDKDTLHFSAKLNQDVVGCVSFMKHNHPKFENELPYQLRGMAVSPKHRGLKIGAQLLAYSERYLKAESEDFIWCNVRLNAVPFYTKQGYTSLGEVFDVEGIGPHILMFKTL